MTTQRARQLLVVLMVCIYSTLGLMHDIMRAIRGAGMLRATVMACFAVPAIVLLRVLWRRGILGHARTWLVIAGAVTAYAIAIRRTMTMEESLHLVEYGLVGILARLSVPPSWSGARAWLGGWLGAVILGWLDEGIQALLPSRHYDVGDVMLNAMAAALPLAAAWLIARIPSSTPARADA